jgi:FMN phosphatase YigB (HAD superfamily)
MKTVIFDLDGTLADIAHRMPLVDGGRKHWKELFLRCVHDKPIGPLIEFCNVLYRTGYVIRILSGRSHMVHSQTVEWLRRHGVQYHSLTMRPEHDYRPDHELKALWLDALVAEQDDILCVFDDRASVVEMWRRRGLTCLQVAEGNF